MKSIFNDETKRFEWVINTWWGKWIFVGGVVWWTFFLLGVLLGLAGY